LLVRLEPRQAKELRRLAKARAKETGGRLDVSAVVRELLDRALGGPTPAAGDLLPASPGAEVAVPTSDGKVHVFTSRAVEVPGFPVDAGTPCSRCFITELNGGAGPVVVAVAPSGKVFAFDGAGQALPGWPQTIGVGLKLDCEVVDWDGDGVKEVLVLDEAGALHILKGGAAPTTLALKASAFCTGDLRPDLPGLEILAANDTEGTATLLDHAGQALAGWPVKLPRAALPTAVRLTRDGPLHALVVQQAQDKPTPTTNTIHLLQADGRPAPGWPVAAEVVAGYALFSRPAVADVDGDGRSEIFFGHTCYAVAGYRADGSTLRGFPLRNVGMVYGTPAIADLDGDGRDELIFADVSSIRSLHAFTLPFAYAPRHAHTPTQEEIKRGFVVTAAEPFDTILPDAPAEEGRLLRSLDLAACAGEFEPATFVVHALRDLDVVLRPADLVLDAAHKVPAANLDLRFVHVWRQRRPDGPGEYLVPELLLKREPGELKGVISQPLTPEVRTRLPAKTARQFWVTVKVPEQAGPGTYEGRLPLVANGTAYPLTCRLRVLPLKLPPDPFVHSIYFHGSSVGLGWYGEKEMTHEAFLARGRRQLADLRDHGLNAAGTYSPAIMTTRGDGYDIDLRHVRESLLLHREAGLTRWVTAELGYSTLDGQQLHPRLGAPFYRAFTALVQAVEKMARAEGLPPVLYYGVDEPMRKTEEEALRYYGFADPVDVCRQWFQATRGGGGRTTAAVYRTEIGGWAILGPLCDVPIFSLGSIYPHTSRAEIVGEVASRSDRQAWYYWQCWTENPLENRLLAGLYLCKSGLSGVMPWAYMGYDGDPYSDMDGTHKDFNIAYPSQEGPIPTLSWEAFREGVDDCRYWAAVKDKPGAQQVLDRLSFSDSQNRVALTGADLQKLRRELVALR
jgi:hypothetical protein